MRSKSKNDRRFRTTRWMQLIFPQELIIDETHVLTRKRAFPAFWIVKEASIPLSKVASIQITRGLFFSSVVIENSGGPFPITIKGVPNKHAVMIRQTLETHDLTRKPDEVPSYSEPQVNSGEKKMSGLFDNIVAKFRKKDESLEFEDGETIEAWWNESDYSETEKELLDDAPREETKKTAWIYDLVQSPTKSKQREEDW